MKKIIAFLLLCSCSNNSEKQSEKMSLKDKLITASITQAADLPTRGKECPSNMVHIVGSYCENLEEVCLKWLDKPICNKYDPNDKTKCIQERLPARCEKFKYPSVCRGTEKPVDFCIDKYEASNNPGEIPPVMVSWYDAKALCESKGKRMCYDYEWIVACQGPDRKPYPYGYTRDKTACNIDKPQRVGFDATKAKMDEKTIAWLDQRVPSGSMPRCVSDYGVYDLTGNVDETTINASGKPYKNSLKGGHWVQGARNRCTPETTIHDESFKNYESSYRCCK